MRRGPQKSLSRKRLKTAMKAKRGHQDRLMRDLDAEDMWHMSRTVTGYKSRRR